MAKKKVTESVNYSDLRKSAGLTLSQLSELTGFGVATINGLEKRGEGSARLKEKVASVLLCNSEEGTTNEVRMWRDRALSAEQKLDLVTEALRGVLKKI